MSLRETAARAAALAMEKAADFSASVEFHRVTGGTGANPTPTDTTSTVTMIFPDHYSLSEVVAATKTSGMIRTLVLASNFTRPGPRDYAVIDSRRMEVSKVRDVYGIYYEVTFTGPGGA